MALHGLHSGCFKISSFKVRKENMVEKYRLLYKPPKEIEKDDDPKTWRKVFYLDKYSCLSKLDLEVNVRALIALYEMNPDYITIENIENNYEQIYI